MYQLAEVTCKHMKPFVATIQLQRFPWDGEKEDGLPEREYGFSISNVNADEIINLPEQTAKFSYWDRKWVVRFYVQGFTDASLSVSDTMFPDAETMETSTVSFDSPPPQSITWGVSASRFTTYCESSFPLFFTEIPIGQVYGWEAPRHKSPALLRYMLFVGARPHNERE